MWAETIRGIKIQIDSLVGQNQFLQHKLPLQSLVSSDFIIKF